MSRIGTAMEKMANSKDTSSMHRAREEMRSLLDQGEPLEETAEYGWTPYMWAVFRSMNEVVAMLAEAGADTSRHGDATLVLAIFEYDAKLARKALEVGANQDLIYPGHSLVNLAAFNGSVEVLAGLLAHGARVESSDLFAVCNWETSDWKTDSRGEHEAYARAVQLLLDHGADPNVKDSEGKTPLQCIEGDCLTLIEDALRAAGGE